jgi:hypothetical protein
LPIFVILPEFVTTAIQVALEKQPIGPTNFLFFSTFLPAEQSFLNGTLNAEEDWVIYVAGALRKDSSFLALV